jgi:hypothetical protein
MLCNDGKAKRNHKIFTIKEDSQLSKPSTHYVSGPELPGTYSCNKIRKTQNDHLNIISQNLNSL